MLDLNKLAEKLDKALEAETAESLNQWLDEKIEKENAALEESTWSSEFGYSPEYIIVDKGESIAGEYQYSCAA